MNLWRVAWHSWTRRRLADAASTSARQRAPAAAMALWDSAACRLCFCRPWSSRSNALPRLHLCPLGLREGAARPGGPGWAGPGVGLAGSSLRARLDFGGATQRSKSSLSCSMMTKIMMTRGPTRPKFGQKPFHRQSGPSARTDCAKQLSIEL
eukprot:Amastigsp_a852585_6.p4 type:complete len:152 gc:universal Amastigsp_a852585_6:1238-783(-)